MANHTQDHDHDFFIPAPSIWPFLACLGPGMMMFGLLALLHVTPSVIGQILTGSGLLLTLFAATSWWRTCTLEGRQQGFTEVPAVLELANRYGIIFFIISEAMFFAGFFAAYFYLGMYNPVFPPASVPYIDIHLPIINTLLLLSSGVTITIAHEAMLAGNRKVVAEYVRYTWLLGLLFLGAQAYEYMHVGLTLSSTVYGGLFYLLTGFHGFHVLVGSIMLMVVSLRLQQGDFSPKHHFYFEAAAWYWHFVDVVWIGLFLFVYVL